MARQFGCIDADKPHALRATSQRVAIDGIAAGHDILIAVGGSGLPT